MPYPIRVHFQNTFNLANPHLWHWNDFSSVQGNVAPSGPSSFGMHFDIAVIRPEFSFKFKAGPGLEGPWEHDRLNRVYRPQELHPEAVLPNEIWCKGDRAFVYDVEPRAAETVSAAEFLNGLAFRPAAYVSDAGGRSALGAHVLQDGRVLFGFYHPNAARVYVIGEFNEWQRPGLEDADPSRFIELQLYRGYFGLPNLWLGLTELAQPGHEYKFMVRGGVPSDEKKRFQQYFTDPYARRVGPSYQFNNSVVVDPTFSWHDHDWRTPDLREAIIYELSVYGFTESDPDIDPAHRGKFQGVTERIEEGYFDRLGITVLSIMPLAEFPSVQGPRTIGYDPSLYFTTERDFGTPDDLRELVDTAHRRGLAVLVDQVFNHTSNGFNPLWRMVLEHPAEELVGNDGGLYFAGSTPWGNRVATDKKDVQNMLIDACKLLIHEYHVDGFRFDATHTNYMDHGFLLRLIEELKQFKPDVLLVAENLPNQPDLNRAGYDGFAQWCDPFHDKIKAMLREGVFQDTNTYSAEGLADIFYFSKSRYAAHTNNVVNYCESHDEHSVSYEVQFTPALNHPAAKERKSRLGLFASAVALGQPMIYMGQEFNTERERNFVTVQWPDDLEAHGYFQWASRLLRLRRRYPGLKISGSDPAREGRFEWVLGAWMPPHRGGGQRLLGWRLRPGLLAHDALLVMLNFENHDVTVEVDFGLPGTWVKLADIDRANDIAPHGTNSAADAGAIFTGDGRFSGFVLPSSSAFLYKWETPA